MDDWDHINKKIEGILQNINFGTPSHKESKEAKLEEEEGEENFEKESDEEMMAVEEIKTTFMDNLAKLREEETIS